MCSSALTSAGNHHSVHPKQSDAQSAGAVAQTRQAGASALCSEDGGSAAGLLPPAAQGSADCHHTAGQHGKDPPPQNMLNLEPEQVCWLSRSLFVDGASVHSKGVPTFPILHLGSLSLHPQVLEGRKAPSGLSELLICRAVALPRFNYGGGGRCCV